MLCLGNNSLNRWNLCIVCILEDGSSCWCWFVRRDVVAANKSWLLDTEICHQLRLPMPWWLILGHDSTKDGILGASNLTQSCSTRSPMERIPAGSNFLVVLVMQRFEKSQLLFLNIFFFHILPDTCGRSPSRCWCWLVMELRLEATCLTFEEVVSNKIDNPGCLSSIQS